MEVGLGRLSIDRRAGRRSWLSDGAGETIKQCWRMDIGQTPIEGQRHGYAILLTMGVRGARNERGNKGEDAQNEEKVQ